VFILCFVADDGIGLERQGVVLAGGLDNHKYAVLLATFQLAPMLSIGE